MQFNLSDLSSQLQSTHVKINKNFIRELMKKAASSETLLRKKEFAQKMGCRYNEKWKQSASIMQWWHGKKTIPFSKLARLVELAEIEWTEVEKNTTFIKSGPNRGEVRITFPIKIDNRLGCIVGHILGDGSIDKKYSQVFFSNSNPELTNEFRLCMLSIFGIEPRIWMQKTEGYNNAKWLKRIQSIDKESNSQLGLFYPKICGTILHAIFGKFADGQKKEITSQIKETSAEFKKALIRAIFDDEANVDAPSQIIRFSQDNKQIIDSLKCMLGEFQIKANPTHSYFRNGKEHSYFNITHIKNYHRFRALIGFTSSQKMKTLENLIKHVCASHKYKNLILENIQK